MLLSDLLEDHTVVYRLLYRDGSGTMDLFQSFNVDEAMPVETGDDDLVVVLLFSIDRAVVADELIFRNLYYFDTVVTVSGQSYHSYYVNVISNSTQPEGNNTVSVHVSAQLYTGTEVEGSDVTLNIGQVYAMVTRWHRYSNDVLGMAEHSICSVDPDTGAYTLITNSNVQGHVLGGGYNTLYYVRTIVSATAHFSGQIYEFDGSYTTYKVFETTHRIFGAVDRLFDFQYLTPAYYYYKTYMFPPKPAFDGSAYDRTEVLIGEIDLLMDEIEDANTALAVAQADIELLQTELDTKPTLAENLASRLSGVNTRAWLANLLVNLTNNGLFTFEAKT